MPKKSKFESLIKSARSAAINSELQKAIRLYFDAISVASNNDKPQVADVYKCLGRLYANLSGVRYKNFREFMMTECNSLDLGVQEQFFYDLAWANRKMPSPKLVVATFMALEASLMGNAQHEGRYLCLVFELNDVFDKETNKTLWKLAFKVSRRTGDRESAKKLLSIKSLIKILKKES